MHTLVIRVDHDAPRVVDSCKEGDEDNSDDSDDLPRVLKYAALSYCWSDRPGTQLELTCMNETELYTGICERQLSAAQRDAIEFTRRVGLR